MSSTKQTPFTIPYRNTGYFSELICDYLDAKEPLQAFYHRPPLLESFSQQIEEKKDFTTANRKVLVDVLECQYACLDTSSATTANIKSLKESNTFTITTGHQLNLFTGPLYFLYKIIHTITLSRKLKEVYPKQNFIPVYWMATEDHDFDEINYFTLRGKKVRWNRADVKENNKGAVGEFDTKGLEAIYEQFCAEVGTSANAKKLCDLFKQTYLEHDNLADATRFLANVLFKKYGIVIIDANDAELKKLFIPYMERELKEEISYNTVNPKTEALELAGYKVQVNPREINLFYLTKSSRERIIKRDGNYYVHDTQKEFTHDEIVAELHEHPERFSPNVIMRPLYQEVILPNLAYIGGGGEIAYWLELKDYFEAVHVPFPILMLRNSALILTEKQQGKTEKLGLEVEDLFLKKNDLINRRIRKISNMDIDFSLQKEHLVQQFAEMYTIAEQTDHTFIGAVKAQEIKQIKGLENLEKRLLKAQKIKLSDQVGRLTALQLEAFPQQNLQERVINFSEFYLDHGEELIPILMDRLNPENDGFTVL